MKAIQPLLFLNVRQLVNGVIRAVKSPKRLIGILFALGYYFMVFGRPFDSGRKSFTPENMDRIVKKNFSVVSLGDVNAAIYALFLAFFLMSLLGLATYTGRFRQADVDTMFPTPIDRRWVIFVKFFRDTLLSVIVPLLVAVIFMRPAVVGFGAFVDKIPNAAGTTQVPRLMVIGWTLMSLAMVAWGYALSFYFNRPEERYENHRRWFFRVITAALLILATYVTLTFRAAPEVKTLVGIAHEPILRILTFPAQLCTTIVLAPVTNQWLAGGLAAAALIGIAAAGLWVAIKQESWVYEIGAMNASKMSEVQDMQAKGDMSGLLAAQARAGKVKLGRTQWIAKRDCRREMAILWREGINFARLGYSFVIISFLLGLMFIGLFSFIPSKKAPLELLMVVFGLGFPAFMTASFSQSGYIEMLRRGDLIKPLPFSPSRTIFYEVIGKCLPTVLVSVLLGVALLILRPGAWLDAIAGVMAASCFGIALSALYCLLIVLFPDVDDPTQRGFRGLMTLLGLIITMAPGVLSFAGIFLLSKSVAAAAATSGIINFALAGVLASVAGNLYRDFNPSE